ncbi:MULTISPECIES: hypothetical protein [Bacillus]|uniref:hypothetical protein n=1 Tax=Bacillus TaxID=1386 RepID=UPI0002B8DAF2|nr:MULTISPECIES: hypothetical protein [Bacillus]MBL3754743.1 hypothetical protein [Bacillus cereus]MCC2412107.1 hypothetical protein [Bacillus paranthracis]MDA1844047.1 hypothetical protein [Bacillus cereus]MDA2143631.1 hypothetical protein [Bacillus cereus group sp. Bc248]MDA2171567.1 hypothetical protein [Bacillus cereus group sp. Bc247]
MILTSLIVGAGILIGGSLLARYWNSVVDWLKRAISKVQEMMQTIIYGTKVFIKKMYEAMQEISKHYTRDQQGQWHETVVTREVSEYDVPPEILAKANKTSQETDITHELELQLN